MPDREKVKAELDEIVEQCRGMDYIGFSTITEHCQNILALLKEQEAENGEWITIWQEDDPDTSTHGRCSMCNRISERPLGVYCKWCGAKMDQEWGVDG